MVDTLISLIKAKLSGGVVDSPIMCGCMPVDDDEISELSMGLSHGDKMHVNLQTANSVIDALFSDLQTQCLEEQERYSRAKQTPPANKQNRWAKYIAADRVRLYAAKSIKFVFAYPECRTHALLHDHLRFLVLLQHFIAEDTAEFFQPESQRQHCDAFTGYTTVESVNSQLVKDAHRSEWTIDGKTFSLKADGEDGDNPDGVDRKEIIADFQRDLVTALETFIVSYCKRRNVSDAGVQRFLQIVTTQMSQCGLANLDRSSKASLYFVMGEGLQQRITYNVSLMDDDTPGESLKLSLLCMKTGFMQYHKEDMGGASRSELTDELGPLRCAPSSYIYQYATLRFAPTVSAATNREGVDVMVIDALDEVHIYPAGI